MSLTMASEWIDEIIVRYSALQCLSASDLRTAWNETCAIPR